MKHEDAIARLLDKSIPKLEHEWAARSEILKLREMVMAWRETYYTSHGMLTPIGQDSKVIVCFPHKEQIAFDREKRAKREALVTLNQEKSQ